MAYLLYQVDSEGNVTQASFMDDGPAEATIAAGGLSDNEKIAKLADDVTPDTTKRVASITLDANDVITSITYEAGQSDAYNAGFAIHHGLILFGQWLMGHSAGVESTIVNKIHDALWRFHQGNHLIAAETSLTKAQKAAIFRTAALGPSDVTIVDASGNFIASGLFPLFQKVNDRDALTGPSTYVDLDVSSWTGGVPGRLSVANIITVPGTVDAILNIDDLSWLDPLK